MVGLPVVAVCESPFHGTTGVIKRLSDLCISVAALVLTAPVMLLVAIAIKLTMPGPVLFKQRRYGLDGQEIIVWKFRSMKVLEDGAGDPAGDPGRRAHHPARRASCAAPRSTNCRSSSTCCRAA